MSVRALLFAALTAAVLDGCAATQDMSATNAPAARLVVERYLAALNRRDLLALTAYVAPDVEWYSAIAADRMLEVSGREALSLALDKYFAEHDRTHWELERADVVDRFVAVVERSEWSEGGRTQSRTSLGVYEIDDGRIRRITYYLNTH